jgi:DNA-3-methyladenine glycosylase
MILPQDFYKQDTIALSKALLGKYLVHESAIGTTVGRIVETEAYLSDDPASHAFGGETNRTTAMFGEPGRVYIYFTYGKHYCLNVTSGKLGVGEAILIRALEPMCGIDIMAKRRKPGRFATSEKRLIGLCNGPAKLVESMGITKELYGHNFTMQPLYITDEIPESLCIDRLQSSDINDNDKFEVITTTRIGISKAKEALLRFYIKDNAFVSR